MDQTEDKIKQVNRDSHVRMIQADLSKSLEPEFYERIYDKMSILDVSILVNNAGVINSDYFTEMSPQTHYETMLTNTGAPVMLSHFMINKLRNRKQRSAIINMSSILNRTPTLYKGLYGAASNFINFMSTGLDYLYRNDNIDVACVTPGVVSTRMSNYQTDDSTCTPEEVAKATLDSLGYDLEIIP